MQNNKQNKEPLSEAIAWGIGAALGVLTRFIFHLALFWVNLWLLNHFGWLPF